MDRTPKSKVRSFLASDTRVIVISRVLLADLQSPTSKLSKSAVDKKRMGDDTTFKGIVLA